MRSLAVSLALSLVVAAAVADMLPGFRLEKVGECEGFLTSIALDPAGNLYYSTTNGGVFKLVLGESTRIATVETANEGNAALLGIAFRGDKEIVAHSVTPDLSADVISSIDVATGEVREIHRFVCEEGRPCPSEHHGGNLIVAADGTIYVGIGDVAGGTPAQLPDSPAGKIHRIAPDGTASIYALGFRNPYDMAFDPSSDRLIVGDNGAIGEDEINLVRQNDNAGWPYTMGTKEPVAGMLRPSYSFWESVAPTGLTAVNGQGVFHTGFLLGTFVNRALYYFPTVADPLERPITILENPAELGAASLGVAHAPPSVKSPIIDVVQDARGDVYIGTAAAIFRLVPPLRGDADGDGKLQTTDGDLIAYEIVDGDGTRTIDAQRGYFRGSWGCDVNMDGAIDARDLVEFAKLRRKRSRGAR